MRRNLPKEYQKLFYFAEDYQDALTYIDQHQQEECPQVINSLHLFFNGLVKCLSKLVW